MAKIGNLCLEVRLAMQMKCKMRTVDFGLCHVLFLVIFEQGACPDLFFITSFCAEMLLFLKELACGDIC